MTDIAEKFKDATIPAVTIEGYDDGNPIALRTLVWEIESIIQELAEHLVEPKTPDFNDDEAFDAFDWAGHDDRIEAQRGKITAEVLGIVWERMSEENKKSSYWDEEYPEFISAEMTVFFAKVRAEEEAEDARIDAELEKAEIERHEAWQANCDKANAKVAEAPDGS